MPDKTLLMETKSKIVKQTESALLQKSKEINQELAEQERRVTAESREKGVYSWYSVLPLEAFGFVLNKGELKDSLRLRYANDIHQ